LNNKVAVVSETESWLREQLRASKTILEQRYYGILFWEDFSLHLVNTKKGRDAYFKETGQLPALQASSNWESEHGSVETHNGKHFIFLSPILIDNRAERDVHAIFIHGILHVIHPYISEKEIRQIEGAVIEESSNEPVRVLEQLSMSRNDVNNQSVLVKLRAKRKD